MNSVRRFASLTRITVGSLALVITSFAYSAGAGWVDSFEQAVQIARQQGRPIFADFSTSWCGVCKQMDRTVLADQNIIARLDNYVKVKIDAEVRNDLSNRYAITGYPTFLYLDPQGRIIERKEGGIRVQEMADALDRGWQSVASQVAVAQANAARKENQTREVASASESRTGRSRIASTENNLLSAPEQPVSARAVSSENPRLARTENKAVAYDRSDPRLADSVYANPEALPASQRSRFGSGNSSLRDLAVATAQPAISEGDDEAGDAAKSEKKSDAEKPKEAKPEKSEVTEKKKDDENAEASKKAEVAKAEESELKKSEAEKAKPEAKEQLTLKAPVVAAKTDVAPVVESRLSGLSEDELPKPLLNRTTGNATQAMAAAPKVSTASAGDPLATIRRIQSEPVVAKPPLVVASATQAPPTVMKATVADTASKSEEKKTDVSSKPAGPAPQGETPKSESPVKPEPAKTETASSGKNSDIERWMKDAESKLKENRKKEARAMYAKVVDNDPKNESGLSDVAYVKMVSLIVDRDSDILRREAYVKIKEFEARYPGSDHKDYYTLIRAILAIDLGETNEAHRLLGTYAERFPDSKYRSAALKNWKELPPVKKESSKKATSDAGSKSRKSSDS